MGATAFFGYLFLAGSPLATVYLVCIARKSFLVLLSLARFVNFNSLFARPSPPPPPLLLSHPPSPLFPCSAFYWLVTLFLISALFRGFTPLSTTIEPYIGLIFVAILIQEAARFLLWRFHKLSLRALEFVSGLQEHAGAELLPNDHFSLSLTHGLAHSIVHTLFFCISWLPLSLGDGTIYSTHCPQMSYYLVSSLATLGFAGILTGAMVLAFEGMERHDWKRGIVLPVGLHLVAALFTLINFYQGGCVVSISLILLEGILVSLFAGKVWWRCTDPHNQRLQVQQQQRERLNGSADRNNEMPSRRGSSGSHRGGIIDSSTGMTARSPRSRGGSGGSGPLQQQHEQQD